MDASNPIHQALSALFIGPHAENIHILEESITTILAELENARKRYAPSDQVLPHPLRIKTTETPITIIPEINHSHDAELT